MSLVNLAEKNDYDALKSALDSGENINQMDLNRNALHAACVTNAVECANLLVRRGINVDAPDNFTGATALHYCAVYNYLEIAKIIVGAGGRLNISDNYGNEPLWTAIFNVKGNIERMPLVELFLKNGADKNHKNNAGKSPLDFANQVKSISLSLLV